MTTSKCVAEYEGEFYYVSSIHIYIYMYIYRSKLDKTKKNCKLELVQGEKILF